MDFADFFAWFLITLLIGLLVSIIVRGVMKELDAREEILNAECVDGKLYKKLPIRDDVYILIEGYVCKKENK